MRLFAVTENEPERMKLMFDTIVRHAQIKQPQTAAKVAYYLGVFSQKVTDYGLDCSEDAAFTVMSTVLQSSLNTAEKLTVFGGLIEFCYLCAWHESESVFQMAYDDQRERG